MEKLVPPLGLPQRGGRFSTSYAVIYWMASSGLVPVGPRLGVDIVEKSSSRRGKPGGDGFRCSLLTSEKSNAPFFSHLLSTQWPVLSTCADMLYFWPFGQGHEDEQA